jgi:hypothetical protein
MNNSARMRVRIVKSLVASEFIPFDVSLLREVVDQKCLGGIQCASARAKGINFQACSFNRRSSRSDEGSNRVPASDCRQAFGFQ